MKRIVISLLLLFIATALLPGVVYMSVLPNLLQERWLDIGRGLLK